MQLPSDCCSSALVLYQEVEPALERGLSGRDSCGSGLEELMMHGSLNRSKVTSAHNLDVLK